MHQGINVAAYNYSRHNTIMGNNSDADGNANTIIGAKNEARGDNNTITGSDNNVKGNGNIISGCNNEIDGSNNIVNAHNLILVGNDYIINKIFKHTTYINNQLTYNILLFFYRVTTSYQRYLLLLPS